MRTCPYCGREYSYYGRVCSYCAYKLAAVRVIARMRLQRPVRMVCTRGGCEWFDGRVCSRECRYAVPYSQALAARRKGVSHAAKQV